MNPTPETYEEDGTANEIPAHRTFSARLRKGFTMTVGMRSGKAVVVEGDDKKRVPVDRESAIANMSKFHETDKIKKHFGLPPLKPRPEEPVSSSRGGGMSETEVRRIVRETVKGEVDGLAALIKTLQASVAELTAKPAKAKR